MHMLRTSAVFLAAILSLSSAANLPSAYITPIPVGSAPYENAPVLTLQLPTLHDQESEPSKRAREELDSMDLEPETSGGSNFQGVSSLSSVPRLTNYETTCRSAPNTELVTDTLLNTMTFYKTVFFTDTFETTNLILNTVFTTLTSTKTIDNEYSITHRMTDYETVTDTQTHTNILPGKIYYKTQTTFLTSTALETVTNTVTNTHRFMLTDYVTRTHLATNIISNLIPVTETEFTTLPPATSTYTEVNIVSSTNTIIPAAMTGIKYSTKLETATEVIEQWVNAPISTFHKTVMIPSTHYFTHTDYVQAVVTDYRTHVIHHTNTQVIEETGSFYYPVTKTEIIPFTISRTTTITREVPQTIYNDILSTTVVPYVDVRTLYDEVTNTKTITETVEQRSTTTLFDVRSVYSTSFYTLAPSTFVNTLVLTPTCSASSPTSASVSHFAGYHYDNPAISVNSLSL